MSAELNEKLNDLRKTDEAFFAEAFTNAMTRKPVEKGVHVLDLPQSGGASVLDEYTRGRTAEGVENPMINDYEAAIPVHIKLDLGASGQPWKIQINASKTFALPAELADTDYLYNLDEVINYPNKTELINKLKSLVPPDIFRKGMEGYDDGSGAYEVQAGPVTVSKTAQHAPELPDASNQEAEAEDTTPAPAPGPVIPKTKSVAPSVGIPKSRPTVPADVESLPGNPVSTPNVSTAMAAARAALGKSAPRS